MPSRLTCSLLLCLLCLARARAIVGTIDTPDDDDICNLTVAVLSARDGSIIETAPVIASPPSSSSSSSSSSSAYTFSLHGVSATDGRYVVRVVGSVAYEYNSVIATIREGTLNASMSRAGAEDALMYPADVHPGPNPPNVHLYAVRRTSLLRTSPHRFASIAYLVELPRLAWRNKFYGAGALAVAFLLWFPHVFHKLPKEMREELTGEKEPDLGDPNKVLKALLGDDAFTVRREHSAPR